MRSLECRLSLQALLALIAMTVFLTALEATAFAQKKSSASGYHLRNRIELGGEGGWDYLTIDDQARRLYVSRSNRVVVVDLDTDKAVGEIPDTPGVHGIAIVKELGRGFTSNGRGGSVTIVDLKTLKPVGKVEVETNPDAIIYDPASRRVFAFNRGSSSVSAIDAAGGTALATMALGGHPEFAAADGKGTVFVNLDDKSEVVAFDSKKLQVKARWPLAPGEDPSGMAIDRKTSRLFIGCGNKKMMVMDATNGRIVADLPIGAGVDATAFDPGTNLAFSSNGDGTLTVVREESPSKFIVVENVATQRGARTMALDMKTHRIYLATAQFGPAPAPTSERPRPRPAIVPGSFVILVFER